LNMKTYIINDSEVSRLSVAIHSTKIKIVVSHQSGRHRLPNTTKQHAAKETNVSSLIFGKYIITLKQQKKQTH
ncbi:hypothetical protein, partial [Klebsiella oxytoca]|uniref:hypothetical protein n=1 Tax=Klebsiella oxytoca TaxID=571 RepID=UPI001CA349D2